MSWKRPVIDSVKNFFEAMEKNLRNRGIDREVKLNPKGETTYRIDEIAQRVYENSFPDLTIISEESITKKNSDFIVFLDPLCGSIFAKRGSEKFTTGIAIYDSRLRPVCEAIGLLDVPNVVQRLRRDGQPEPEQVET